MTRIINYALPLLSSKARTCFYVSKTVNEMNEVNEDYHSGTTGDVYVSPVASTIPLHWCREESGIRINPVEASKISCVGIKDDAISSGRVNANAVVAEALCGMEVENENQSSSFKNNDFVSLMLERDVGLRSMQPTECALSVVHGLVEIVQKSIPKKMVFGQIQLPTGIPERIVVSLTRKVQPFRVPKLIALKIEITFATK